MKNILALTLIFSFMVADFVGRSRGRRYRLGSDHCDGEQPLAGAYISVLTSADQPVTAATSGETRPIRVCAD